ncbi:class IV adenylate cyclase [Candidatus Shapirobacteria bacterium]|nr:class IV adenylate cyclase [Candidatus Shapirobacteria bacterium]
MFNQKYKEIEIKYQITDIASFRNSLKKLGGKSSGEFFQRTTRFETVNRDLEKKGLFLRVRTGEENTLTIKRKSKEDKNYREREEWETEISNPEAVIKGLKALGYTKLLIMEKYRETFILPSFPNLKVTIDRLPFGNFTEIEGEEEDIEKMIAKLNLSGQERITATYWRLHEEYSKKRGSTEENIVFDPGTD